MFAQNLNATIAASRANRFGAAVLQAQLSGLTELLRWPVKFRAPG